MFNASDPCIPPGSHFIVPVPESLPEAVRNKPQTRDSVAFLSLWRDPLRLQIIPTRRELASNPILDGGSTLNKPPNGLRFSIESALVAETVDQFCSAAVVILPALFGPGRHQMIGLGPLHQAYRTLQPYDCDGSHLAETEVGRCVANMSVWRVRGWFQVSGSRADETGMIKPGKDRG